MLGYIFNRFTNLIIYCCSQKLYNEYFSIIFISIYGASYIISIIFYLIFEGLVASAIKHKENGNQNKKEFLVICGYLLYYEKIPVNNDKTYNIENLENNKLITNNTNSIKKDNKISNTYTNAININSNNKVASEVDNTCDKICSKLFPCCTKSNKYFCASCKLGFRKCYYNTSKIIFLCECCKCCKCEECCSCCPCCQCCLCCKPLKIKESYEEEENFCYAYKVQRKCSWFCDLLWKDYFIALIICNILVEIQNIGFEKKLNEDVEKIKLYQNIIIIVIYLSFFIILAIIIRNILKKNSDIFLLINIKKIKKIFSFFIFIPLMLSSFYLLFLFLQLILKLSSKFSGKIEKIIELLEKLISFCFIPIYVSSVKFLNFYETELLLVVLDTRGIDILSYSFILSSFYIIYDIIVFIITDIYDCDTKILIWVQFGFSASIFISIFIIAMLVNKK